MKTLLAKGIMPSWGSNGDEKEIATPACGSLAVT
jgi:hypothetical protein